MEAHLMKQMVRGRTLFVSQPRLTPYPCGGYKTPGAGMTKSLYNVYQPIHTEMDNGLKLNKEVASEIKKQNEKQEGFGNPLPAESMDIETSNKRKIDEDVFQKMQHPIYKVTKIKKPKIEAQLAIGKGEEEPTPSSSSSSLSSLLPNPSTAEKKYFKF
jgi:hypothetical protein